MTLVPGTRPYPWPYDERLAGSHLALVLAGWDDHWLGRVAPGEAADAATASAALASAVLAAGGRVLTVAHGGAAPLDAPGLVDGVDIVPAVGLDGFWGGPLESRLRSSGRTHLLVAGHGLEAPVHSLLRGANDRGFECLLVLDATSALTPDCRDAAASMVCMSGGIFGAVGSTAAVLTTLEHAQELIP